MESFGGVGGWEATRLLSHGGATLGTFPVDEDDAACGVVGGTVFSG